MQAAVRAAVSGDLIELDFDIRLEERPLELANIDLTVRAAQGRRPILVFRPGDADAVGYPRSMVVVAGGSLSISGVEIELEMPRKISADAWALIEIRRAERLQFQRTTLTIRNAGANQTAFHPSVAFFDLRTPLGSDTMGMGATLATAPPQIELVDCVVRGEATCLRTSEFEPVWLSWNNGLLATSETLLQAEAAAGRTRASGGVEIDLRRVTAIVRGGLARLTNNEDLPYLLDTKIECIASAIVTDPASPLIQQRGIDTISQFRAHFLWSAKNVDFEGSDLFWRIVSTPTGDSSDWNFAEWEAFWEPKREGNSRRGLLPWLVKAAAKRRLSELSPADLAQPAGDAEIAASSDLGGEPRLLPIPSIPSAAEIPATSGSKPAARPENRPADSRPTAARGGAKCPAVCFRWICLTRPVAVSLLSGPSRTLRGPKRILPCGDLAKTGDLTSCFSVPELAGRQKRWPVDRKAWDQPSPEFLENDVYEKDRHVRALRGGRC